MLCFLLLLMVTACTACTEGLKGQTLAFTKTSDTDSVKVDSSIQTFSAITVCLRVKTDLVRNHVIFSLSAGHEPDAVVMEYKENDDVIEVEIDGKGVDFKGLKYDRNRWHSICLTWDSNTGFVQLWLDGHSTVRKYVSQDTFSDTCIILGQEQDIINGGFDQHQSFVGYIADLHVWDYVLNACEIQSYMDYQRYCPGNAVNWNELSYHITGKVLTLDRPFCALELASQSQNSYAAGSHYGGVHPPPPSHPGTRGTYGGDGGGGGSDRVR